VEVCTDCDEAGVSGFRGGSDVAIRREGIFGVSDVVDSIIDGKSRDGGAMLVIGGVLFSSNESVVEVGWIIDSIPICGRGVEKILSVSAPLESSAWKVKEALTVGAAFCISDNGGSIVGVIRAACSFEELRSGGAGGKIRVFVVWDDDGNDWTGVGRS
jgi:hypothetical protein